MGVENREKRESLKKYALYEPMMTMWSMNWGGKEYDQVSSAPEVQKRMEKKKKNGKYRKTLYNFRIAKAS